MTRSSTSCLAAFLFTALAGCASDAPSSRPVNGDRTPNAKTLYSMSKIMVSRSKDGEAESILSKLIHEHPDFMPAYEDLAELYLRHDRIDSAIEVLKSGVKSSPQDAVLWNNLGMCRMVQKQYGEALTCFTNAAAGEPRDARSRANLAVALGMLGRYDESLALYLQILSPAEAHHNLGVLCEARKDNTRALQEFATSESLGSTGAEVARQ
jgi:tetratricopeptide (TPR) repeat protein